VAVRSSWRYMCNKINGMRTACAKHQPNWGVFIIRDGRIAEVREYLDTRHAANVRFQPQQT
jgi:ketosteroid isomerase-like protein